jgi:hypothetical protein
VGFSSSREEEISYFGDDRLPAWTILAQSLDNGSITSLASKDTVRWQNLKCPEWDKVDPELEMERSPPVQFNPGPPFAFGDIVLCDVEEFGLTRGLVTRAENSGYIICLDNGHVVDTSKTPEDLIPSYVEWKGNTNDFVPYVEPPIFIKLRSEMTQLGSFGTHIYAQRTALWTVVKAKDCAKAVKADDAGIPLHLWNDLISLAGVTLEVIGVALAAFRKFGWLWFMKIKLLCLKL